MQLSQQEQTTLNTLQSLLKEDLYTIDQMIDLNTEAYMNFHILMAKDGYSDPVKADRMNYTLRHTTRVLRCFDQLRFISRLILPKE